MFMRRPFWSFRKKDNRMNHRIVELSGGPQSGKVFREVGVMFTHNPGHQYSIGGQLYRPWKMMGGVLFLKWIGVDSGPETTDDTGDDEGTFC